MSLYQLPSQVPLLGLDPEKYRMGDDHSFRGPCISCGGSHRMVVFTSNPFPHWWLLCDLCGLEGWLDQFFQVDGIPEERTDETVKKEVDQADLQKKIALFKEEKSWLRMHANLTDASRQWWRGQGIPDSWQNFWKLGYKEKHQFVIKDRTWESEAYTIPKFKPGWDPTNIDYRIITYPMGAGKYRPVFGLPAAAFYSRPDLANLSEDGRVIIVEGSKKAMVLCSRLKGMQVIGLPGCRVWVDIVEAVKDLEQVIVILDPDAEVASKKLAFSIGKNTLQLTMPTKPDDAFINGWIDEPGFWSMLKRSGRRIP